MKTTITSAPTRKVSESHHYHPYKKKLKNWKSMTFLGPIRELRSQDKLPLKNQKTKANPESRSRDLPTWRRSC